MKLGDKVQDSITGHEGIITGICDYLTGCRQRLVQPKVKADGAWSDGKWIDEDRLSVTEAKAARLKVTTAGADIPAPIK